MEKKYLYFQPEYVGKFKCDGSKCNARCCKNWNIFIDKETYKKYSQEIIGHMKFDSEHDEYLMTLNEKNFCPMLTENNLCRLQRDYGEEFLSKTCATYPRYTRDFGNFFERSLVLTCPVAAEMILFQEEPMQFELIEVPEKIHSNGGKIAIAPVKTMEGFAELMLEFQIAQISVLQERTLTIDQRLIVLGFFLDRLEELTSEKVLTETEAIILIGELKRLIATYESKKFLREQVPRMIQIVSLDTKKFIELVFNLFESFYGGKKAKLSQDGGKFMNTVIKTLEIKPDENNFVSVLEIVAKYERLADARKNFLKKYSTFLENYLVNEFFMNVYPYRFEKSITKNYAVFVTSYKIFELILFSATQKKLDSKKDLLEMVNWFTTQSDHNNEFYEKILEHFKAADDIFPVMESLLDGQSYLDMKKAVL